MAALHENVTLNFRVSARERDTLRRLAVLADISMTALIRHWIKQHDRSGGAR